jgi:hypothetical protein
MEFSRDNLKHAAEATLAIGAIGGIAALCWTRGRSLVPAEQIVDEACKIASDATSTAERVNLGVPGGRFFQDVTEGRSFFSQVKFGNKRWFSTEWRNGAEGAGEFRVHTNVTIPDNSLQYISSDGRSVYNLGPMVNRQRQAAAFLPERLTNTWTAHPLKLPDTGGVLRFNVPRDASYLNLYPSKLG